MDWPELTHIIIMDGSLLSSNYRFETEAPWYYACHRAASIRDPILALCHLGQRTLPCIELSNDGEETNVWKDVTRRSYGASDTELWFCRGWKKGENCWLGLFLDKGKPVSLTNTIAIYVRSKVSTPINRVSSVIKTEKRRSFKASCISVHRVLFVKVAVDVF